MAATPAMMPGARPPAPREDPGAIPIDAPLAPVPIIGIGEPFNPATPPGDPRRHVPLYGIQYLRREALRLTIERYNDIDATDDEILTTAKRFAEFIRTGKNPEGH